MLVLIAFCEVGILAFRAATSLIRFQNVIFSGRVLAGCFWFCILIWISTYTANLAAFFTVRNSERQINTLEDVVEGDYPMYIMRDSAIHQFLRLAEYHTYRKLWERISVTETFVNSTEEGYGTARRVPHAVFMAEKPSTEYVVKQKPCDLRTGLRTQSNMNSYARRNHSLLTT